MVLAGGHDRRQTPDRPREGGRGDAENRSDLIPDATQRVPPEAPENR